MNGPSPRYQELARLDDKKLEAIFAASSGPDPESLAGFEFRGYNTPAWASCLGIRKFIKGFFDSSLGVEGYNIPPVQNGLDEPWLHKPSPEAPTRFGFFLVGRVRADGKDGLYPKAILLDYGSSPRNAAYRPERVLRDYVVQPDAANPDLFLGKAYLALGPRFFSNFFVIERLRRTEWKP